MVIWFTEILLLFLKKYQIIIFGIIEFIISRNLVIAFVL